MMSKPPLRHHTKYDINMIFMRSCTRPIWDMEPFLGGATSALGIKFPSFHAEKRAVLAQGACSTELPILPDATLCGHPRAVAWS